jgi:hypothetical protein
MHRSCIIPCLLAAALAAPRPTRAEEEPPGEEEQDLPEYSPPAAPAPVAEAPARLAPAAALRVAATLPLDDLGVGGWLGLELGLRPPWLGGRLLPATAITWTRATAEGRAAGGALAPEAPLDWALHLDQLGLGGDLRVRLLRHAASFSPEVGGGAEAILTVAHLDGQQGGEPLAPVREVGWGLGWHASAGMSVALGPGHLLVEAGLRSVALDGVLTGTVPSRAVLAGLGYRVLPW